METAVYNPQKGRLETIDVEFTHDNATWFIQPMQQSRRYPDDNGLRRRHPDQWVQLCTPHLDLRHIES